MQGAYHVCHVNNKTHVVTQPLKRFTIEYNPTDSWHFNINADVVNYSSKSFDNITVPLASAEVSYSMLKNKKGTLSLESYDLLDKNSGISRVSEMNYLRETRSNNMGRYVMASFKYKI